MQKQNVGCNIFCDIFANLLAGLSYFIILLVLLYMYTKCQRQNAHMYIYSVYV